MLPRIVQRETRLIHDGGQLDVAIIYPQVDPAYRRLAQKLAGALNQFSSNHVELLADRDLMPAANQPLPGQYRTHPLILLGNLNTNRALLPLYASYLCFTDAVYPGGEGYDLRTLVNPYGKGGNVILAGGSSLKGVERAVERLIVQIEAAGKPGELTLPYLMEVELEPDLKQKLFAWPDTPLGAPLPKDSNELLKRCGAYGIMYAITGDRRFGELGGECLRTVNARRTDSYGDQHYNLERMMRALPWLEAGGFLSDAEILRTDELLLGMALASQDAWWRMKSAQIPLGHRHHGKGTHEFYLVARFLRQQAAPEPVVAELCERWMGECQIYLDALGRAGIDDQDDETTMNNMITLFWFGLGEERFDFFESGGARAWALRAIALHDNLGAAAGPGGYGESQLGITFLQHEATTAVAACAFYYQDGRFKWILEHMPHLALPLRGAWALRPIFIHKFDTGPELEPQEPEGLAGLQLLPATHYQFELNNNPPQHFEYQGHMVNAPENWLSPEGVGANHLLREHGFDKLVLRAGYRWEDAYLLIQGYQGGFRFQGHMKAANCIIRFSQAGHVFLMQNTRAHSQYYKNGVLVSDGFNDLPVPPITEWLALDDFPQAGLSVTRLNEYHHTAWSRHLFWSKGEHDFFVVVDCITPEVDGEYAAVCTWRSLVYASLEGRTWQADQGNQRFTLRSSEALCMTNQEERDLGAANPYVLHQFQGGTYRKGEPFTFQNVFYVRPLDGPEEIDIRRITPEQAVILRGGRPSAWLSATPDRRLLQGLGFEVEANSAWATPDNLILAGATGLQFPGIAITSDWPVGLDLELARGKLAARIDGPASRQATLRIHLDGQDQTLNLAENAQIEIELPASPCQGVSAEIGRQLAGMNLPEIPARAPLAAFGDRWQINWKWDGTNQIHERIREMTVQASPPPLDGIADQLIDTVTLEPREIWRFWPEAPSYEIMLTFPPGKAIESLNLIGDSRDDPIFKVFSPLPAGIRVDASRDGFERDVRPCEVAPGSGEISIKRYRGILDRLETRKVNVNQAALQVRITIPAPDEGRPLVFQEIEVYGTRRVRPAISHLLSADLHGAGRSQVITVDTTNALVVLDPDGTRSWRYQFPAYVNHLSCHDLYNDGRQYVCAGLLGGDLVILAPDGKVWKHLKLAEQFSSQRDIFFGQYNTLYSLGVWQRDAHGRAALAIGAYSMILFLDPEGEIIGHSWFDGPWIVNLLTVPQGEPGAGDLWARCGWNHGIGHYEGKHGFAPSGEGLVFGGVRQPMFRPLRKLIPFANGRTAAYEWYTRDADLGRVIVAAVEDGVGVLSTRSQDFLWKVEGGTTITACMVSETQAGLAEVVIGGVDGFVAAFNLADGRPLRRWWAGAPIVGLASSSPENQFWTVVTEQGVWALDADWRPQAFYPLEAARMCISGERSVTIACKDGSLVSLKINPNL